MPVWPTPRSLLHRALGERVSGGGQLHSRQAGPASPVTPPGWGPGPAQDKLWEGPSDRTTPEAVGLELLPRLLDLRVPSYNGTHPPPRP